MTESPALKLVTPKPAEPMPKAVDTTLSLTDFVSPSHWILWAIEKICGVNPAKWVGDQLGGDWESIATMSSALEHVGEFYKAYAKAIDEDSGTMLKNWEGNAADACGKYFQNFSDTLTKQVPAIEKVAGECQSVAFGAWSTSKSVVSFLEMLCDLAVMVAIEAAAAAATSWTIVGPSVAMAAIMAKIAMGIKLWLKIISLVGLTVAAVFGVIGMLSGVFGALHGLDAQPLPNSYDNKVI
jgi:sarcosine oxidase delta subunit